MVIVLCRVGRLGLRVISDYLSTRESGESGVCPSCVGLWETSMSLSSMLFMGIECCVVSLLLVVLTLRVPSGEGCLFICWIASSP